MLKNNYPPDWWYEDHDLEMYECRGCDDKEERKDRAKEWLESVVEQLYSSKPLDPMRLENDLDELCHYLDIKLKAGDLKVQRAMAQQQPNTNKWITLYN